MEDKIKFVLMEKLNKFKWRSHVIKGSVCEHVCMCVCVEGGREDRTGWMHSTRECMLYVRSHVGLEFVCVCVCVFTYVCANVHICSSSQ